MDDYRTHLTGYSLAPGYPPSWCDTLELFSGSEKILKTGMVFQNFGPLPNQMVINNVAYALQIQHVDKRKHESSVMRAIVLGGLKRSRSMWVHDYFSKEEFDQRLQAARKKMIKRDLESVFLPVGWAVRK
jgi:ABC-type nitrate/sulfonate/bicarbonate transport system ATPase subunit